MSWNWTRWEWENRHRQGDILTGNSLNAAQALWCSDYCGRWLWIPLSPISVPNMTYNVFGGRLNLTQSIIPLPRRLCFTWFICLFARLLANSLIESWWEFYQRVVCVWMRVSEFLEGLFSVARCGTFTHCGSCLSNNWWDVHGNFTTDVPLDKEVPTKLWKSPWSGFLIRRLQTLDSDLISFCGGLCSPNALALALLVTTHNTAIDIALRQQSCLDLVILLYSWHHSGPWRDFSYLCHSKNYWTGPTPITRQYVLYTTDTYCTCWLW